MGNASTRKSQACTFCIWTHWVYLTAKDHNNTKKTNSHYTYEGDFTVITHSIMGLHLIFENL